eukprot:3667488-Prymnesium_polylepis.1
MPPPATRSFRPRRLPFYGGGGPPCRLPGEPLLPLTTHPAACQASLLQWTFSMRRSRCPTLSHARCTSRCVRVGGGSCVAERRASERGMSVRYTSALLSTRRSLSAHHTRACARLSAHHSIGHVSAHHTHGAPTAAASHLASHRDVGGPVARRTPHTAAAAAPRHVGAAAVRAHHRGDAAGATVPSP